MVTRDIIVNVLTRMAQLRVTQSELASACDLSQPHLSKVLSYKIKLASKTERKLAAWLELAGSTAESTPHNFLEALATRLESVRPGRRMQIMELLRAVERLVGN
jgi:predicted XRE-type DNA-binding protein